MSGDNRVLELDTLFRAARQRARDSGRPVLAVHEFPWECPAPLDLFEALQDTVGSCFYWETRSPQLTLLGFGTAQTLSADAGIDSLDEQWRALASSALGDITPMAMGGFRFDESSRPRWPWSQFPAQLLLPRLLLKIDGSGCRLLCQKLVCSHHDPYAEAYRYHRDILALLQPQASEQAAGLPTLIGEWGVSQQAWQAKAESLIEQIHAGTLQKVVLARQTHRAYSSPLFPAVALGQLGAADARSHLFALRSGGVCFLGATPERLVSVSGGKVRTHALAGTVARGKDAESDQRLGEALLNSRKDLHEHQLVVEAIRDTLVPHVEELSVAPGPTLHRLPTMQHLSTAIDARVGEKTGILQLVQALQPTPAVAGFPSHEALASLRMQEGFDRGCYAGPLGWVDGEGNGDFAVALRSALIRGRHCHLFAGCGLVADSEVEREYRESQLKLSSIRRALANCH